MKIDAEMKILTNINFEWKTMALPQNYLEGEDGAADDGVGDYLQDWNLQIEGEVDGFVQRVAVDLGINKSIADPHSTHSNGTKPHRTYSYHLLIKLAYKNYYYFQRYPYMIKLVIFRDEMNCSGFDLDLIGVTLMISISIKAEQINIAL